MIGARFHDEILPTTRDVLRQRPAEETKGLLGLGIRADAKRPFTVIQQHAIIAVSHPHAGSNEVISKVMPGALHLPRLIIFRPDDDLPQIAIIPHEFPASQQRATLHLDALGQCGDLVFTARLGRALDMDHGAGNAVRPHVAKGDIPRHTAGRGADDENARADVGFPRVLPPGRIETTPLKKAAVPDEGDHVRSAKDHPTRLVAQCGGQMETGSMGKHGRVRWNRHGFLPGHTIIARRDRDHAATAPRHVGKTGRQGRGVVAHPIRLRRIGREIDRAAAGTGGFPIPRGTRAQGERDQQEQDRRHGGIIAALRYAAMIFSPRVPGREPGLTPAGRSQESPSSGQF